MGGLLIGTILWVIASVIVSHYVLKKVEDSSHDDPKKIMENKKYEIH